MALLRAPGWYDIGSIGNAVNSNSLSRVLFGMRGMRLREHG